MAGVTFTKHFSDFDTALGGVARGHKLFVGKVAGASSYTTGGDVFTPAAIDPRATELISLVICGVTSDGLRFYQWNGSTSAPKLKSFAIANGAETTAETDLDQVEAFCFALLR